MSNGTPQFPIRQATQEDTLAAELARDAEIDATFEKKSALTEPEIKALLMAARGWRKEGDTFSLLLESASQKLEDWLNAQ